MNILITGAWQCSQNQINIIHKMGHEVRFMQYEDDKLPCEYSWVEGIICNGLFKYHKIEKFNNLQRIQLTSVGYDRVPMDYLKEHGIMIDNIGGVFSVPMSEFAICGVLQLYKQSRYFANNQLEHRWKKSRNLLELSGKRVCIIGCGNVGTECAKRFSAFGCDVIGVDTYIRRNECFFSKMVSWDTIGVILKDTDIVVLSLPLTEQTHHLINTDIFAQMKSGSVLVNISRGGIVDTEALIKALPDLGGAVLDVFEDEPLDIDSPLWAMENVIITPHNSFVGDGNIQRINRRVLENVEKW